MIALFAMASREQTNRQDFGIALIFPIPTSERRLIEKSRASSPSDARRARVLTGATEDGAPAGRGFRDRGATWRVVNPHRRNWVAERSWAAIHLDWIIKVEQVFSCRQSIRARDFSVRACDYKRSKCVRRKILTFFFFVPLSLVRLWRCQNCRCEKTKMPLSSNMLLIFFSILTTSNEKTQN